MPLEDQSPADPDRLPGEASPSSPGSASPGSVSPGGPSPASLYDRPSKTRMKQVSHELQALGEAVVELPDSRIDGLAISERLLDAIRQYKKTRTHEGRRRQMQYIGKLMRGDDVAPIRPAVLD